MDNSNVKIEQLELNKVKNSEYNNLVFVGESRAGKTTKLIKILETIKNDYSAIILISETAEAKGDYKGLIHDGFIFNNFAKIDVPKIIELQDEYMKKQEKNPKLPPRKILIVMDDVLGDLSWKTSKDFQNIFFSGRNHNIFLILSVQYLYAIPSSVRANISYLFVLNMKRNKDVKTFFNEFWDINYGTKINECASFINAASSDFFALVVDNVNKKCDNMSDKFFRFKVNSDDVKRYKTRSFLIGDSRLSKKLTDKYYDVTWNEKKKKKDTKIIKKNNKKIIFS
jgi:hypothetical protein